MPKDEKDDDKPLGQYLEERLAELENWRGDPSFIKAKTAEIRFWIRITNALNRLTPSAGITDETPISVITQHAVNSLRRLVELEERLVKPRKPGSGRKSSFTPEDVRQAIRSLGVKATQKKVASKLGVTERALRAWQKKQGFAKWADTKKRYLRVSVVYRVKKPKPPP